MLAKIPKIKQKEIRPDNHGTFLQRHVGNYGKAHL
jgi:hypothetical protein